MKPTHKTFKLLSIVTLAVAIGLPSALLFADGPEQGAGAWVTGFVNAPMGSHFTFSLQLEPRFSFTDPGLDRTLIRPGVRLNLPFGLSIGGGVSWFHVFTSPASRNDEFQTWEDIQHHVQLGSLSLTNRLRLEERFLQGRDDVGLRLRYLIRGQVPVNSRGLSAVAWNELFVNTNNVSDGPSAGVDQNRTFVGANERFNDEFQVELGYMLNYTPKPSGPNQMNHVVVITTTYNF